MPDSDRLKKLIGQAKAELEKVGIALRIGDNSDTFESFLGMLITGVRTKINIDAAKDNFDEEHDSPIGATVPEGSTVNLSMTAQHADDLEHFRYLKRKQAAEKHYGTPSRW